MSKLGRVLIVDDEEEICEALAGLVRGEGLVPVLAHDGVTALACVRAEAPDVVLVELRMAGMDGMEVMRRAKSLDEDLPVILITACAEVRGAVEAMRAGAHDYLSKPFDQADVIRVVLRALGERELKRRVKNLSSQIRGQETVREVLGPSDAVSHLIADVNRVARSNFSVVILGETGSGKEVVARAIHEQSPRSAGPFIPVDCGAIPETLLEGELFGHEKGAFTSAVARQQGKLEAARGGTLFLDEIANLPLGSQAKLLRTLQEKTFYRIGSSRPISVDVRVLAACNQDLLALTESDAFRRDLYFRLSEFVVRVPPLRDRREDILYLAKRFLDITNAELQKTVQGFSESAVEALLAYHWPGNARELRSCIRRAVLLAEEAITEKLLDITRHPRSPAGATPARRAGDPVEDAPLKEIVRRNTVRVERELILQALRDSRWNKAKAARMLRIDYKTMHSKFKEYGLAAVEEEAYGQAG